MTFTALPHQWGGKVACDAPNCAATYQTAQASERWILGSAYVLGWRRWRKKNTIIKQKLHLCPVHAPLQQAIELREELRTDHRVRCSKCGRRYKVKRGWSGLVRDHKRWNAEPYLCAGSKMPPRDAEHFMGALTTVARWACADLLWRSPTMVRLRAQGAT